jgi:hypothetical protein
VQGGARGQRFGSVQVLLGQERRGATRGRVVVEAQQCLLARKLRSKATVIAEQVTHRVVVLTMGEPT